MSSRRKIYRRTRRHLIPQPQTNLQQIDVLSKHIERPKKLSWFQSLLASPLFTNRWNGKPYSQNHFHLLRKRASLPVWHQKQQFLDAIKHNQTVILVGETGSGKTTQIPQFVLESADLGGMVACTQPRRIAAVSVSKRVAKEMDVDIGGVVGYGIRFQDCSSRRTVLKYLTDGLLLSEAIVDPLLKRYKVIVLDEVHERTLATDVLIGLLKGVVRRRPDFKLVVMSATLEVEKFRDYFGEGVPVMKVPGRVHPVEVVYSEKPVGIYLRSAVETVLNVHAHEGPGDVLVFLTGQEEVELACKMLRERIADLSQVTILPLYSALPLHMQKMVFKRAPGRKIVVSTNVAETSLTIEGVAYVVDCGLAKEKDYGPDAGSASLLVSEISKASANQRAGRAGRTQPGKCFRLYTEETFNKAYLPQAQPEILRSNVTSMILTLVKLGVDPVNFDFVDPPKPETVTRAVKILCNLGALDEDGKITNLGRMMSEFPIDPEMAKMLIVSPQFGCSSEILSICAMLSVPNCFLRPMNAQRYADEAKDQFIHESGDHLTLLNVYRAYKQNNRDKKWCLDNFLSHRCLKYADSVRKQLASIMARFDLKICSIGSDKPDYSVNIRKALVAGYFMQMAHMSDILNGEGVWFHPSSCFSGCRLEWVIYGECLLTENAYYLCTVTEVDSTWLSDIAPHYHREFLRSTLEQETFQRSGAACKNSRDEKLDQRIIVDEILKILKSRNKATRLSWEELQK